jgi:hypothetical protein
MTESMRRILLALIVFACVAPAAEAAQRDQRSGPSAGRPAQAAPSQARTSQARPQQARAQATRPQATRAQASRAQPTRTQAGRSQATRSRQAARQPASNLRPGDVRTSSSGILVRGASAATISREAPSVRGRATSSRNAVASCTRRNGRTTCAPARSSVAGWQSGLPAANFSQRECPEGTFATLARGHDDVVRCMPL